MIDESAVAAFGRTFTRLALAFARGAAQAIDGRALPERTTSFTPPAETVRDAPPPMPRVPEVQADPEDLLDAGRRVRDAAPVDTADITMIQEAWNRAHAMGDEAAKRELEERAVQAVRVPDA